jgi:hypothetical protein
MSILALTSDTLIVTPASGNLEYNGQFFGTDSAGSRAQLQRIVRATAVASTSGTSIDFTGIPAWVEKITVMFSGVSTNGSSAIQVQIGSGSFTTSGYLSYATSTFSTSSDSSSSTSGLLITTGIAAAATVIGAARLNNITGNTWVMDGSHGGVNGAGTSGSRTSGGSLALGGTLDRVRITTSNGTDTFDAGSVNILYEG